MSDATYYREYREREVFRKWSEKHEATPTRIEQHKKAKAKYRENNREKLRLQAIEHHRANRDLRNSQARNRYRKNPERCLAQLKVRRAVVKGLLAKTPCACGSVKVQGHHPDYSKPLEVIWMCKSCHQKWHHAN